MVNSQEVFGGRVSQTIGFKVSRELHQKYRRSMIRGGEVLLTLVGANFGQVAVAPPHLEGFNCSRAVGLLPVVECPDFVAMCLRSRFVRRYMDNWANTTAQPTFNLADVASLPIPWPPLPERLAIAHILGTLDDKVELNRRRNQTLEAMAHALFKDWFVDFGPVRAKMEAREPYLPADLWQLFPDRLDDEGKPEGWEKRPIYEFSNVVYGAPFASNQFNTAGSGLPLIRIRDLASQEPSVWTEEVHPKGHLIEPGDIVVGMDGEFRLHIWKGQPAWLNQRVCHFEPLRGVPSSFLVGALAEPLAFFERGKVGTTVIHLGKGDIDTFRLLHPGDNVLHAFAGAAEPWVAETVRNALESRTLADLRDTLLPKLISGELRIKDAERFMDRVAPPAPSQAASAS